MSSEQNAKQIRPQNDGRPHAVPSGRFCEFTRPLKHLRPCVHLSICALILRDRAADCGEARQCTNWWPSDLALDTAMRSPTAAATRPVTASRCQGARFTLEMYPRQGSNPHLLLVLISSKGNVSRDADGGALSIRPRRLLVRHLRLSILLRIRRTQKKACPRAGSASSFDYYSVVSIQRSGENVASRAQW